MARTNRGSTPAAANVQALDNLNLDDMFDEGGDDLFDGLDIDLGNMDDITGGGASLTADSVAGPLPAPEEGPASPEDSSRRKTKRKSKAPLMYEDNDDDLVAEPPKKKKKGVKSVTKGPKTIGVTFNDESSKAIQGNSKIKTKSQSSGAGAVVRTGSLSSTVAAAGQFGRRVGSFSLPKGRTKPPTRPDSKSKLSSQTPGGTHDPAAVASATFSALRQVLVTHPGLKQSSFCGLSPSSTVFYPFLPSLPSDLAMKSRKVYVFLERIQSAFASMHGKSSTDSVKAAVESDAIFRLLHEAFREPVTSAEHATLDAAGRMDMVGTAIGSIRQTVTSFDTTKLVGDLYAMCELLKRQHDFLKQNLDNMEKWCKKNFTDEDYASVYLPPKSKKRKANGISEETLLRSFNRRLLKVRVSCIGFKEPKTVTPLRALLPMQYAPSGHDAASITSSPKAKKKKVSNDFPKHSKNVSGTSAVTEKCLPYPDCKPPKRRKMITDTLSHVARELEMRFQRRVDDRDQLVRRQETELKKVIDEDEIPIVHTAGMWRWIEKSGLFAPFTKKDVDDRLGVLRQHLPLPPANDKSKRNTLLERADSSYQSSMDRLTSLLVEENASDDDESEHEYDVDFASDRSSKDEFFNDETSLDLSSLSFAERSTLHLEMAGLKSTSSSVLNRTHHFSNLAERCAVSDGEKSATESEVESVLHRMTSDLNNLESTNALRAVFLESLARSANNSLEGIKRRRDEEVATIARCQQLLKKNREQKSKPAKFKSTQDELALPW